MGENPHGRRGQMGKLAHMGKINPDGKKWPQSGKINPDGKNELRWEKEPSVVISRVNVRATFGSFSNFS